MNPPFWPRLGGTFAIGLAALVADKATSAEPPMMVVPATYTEPAPPEPEVERFHGTVKVSPVAPPAPVLRPPMVVMTPPEPIVQVEARSVQTIPDTRVSDAVVDTLQTVREDTRRVSSAAALLLGEVGGWLKAPAISPVEPRAVFPITISYPAPAVSPQPAALPQAAPWLIPIPAALPATPVTPISASTQPQAQPVPQQPTIIVIRDAAAPAPVVAAPVVAAPAPVPAPVVEPMRGVGFAPESLLGFGVGLVGLGIGLMSWIRSSRQKKQELAPTTASIPPSPASPPLDGVFLAGGLYAGPRPDLAEPFDLGPTYEDEQLAKKRLEEENQNAVLEFILSQNLALQAAFAGPTVDETPAEPAGPVPAID